MLAINKTVILGNGYLYGVLTLNILTKCGII